MCSSIILRHSMISRLIWAMGNETIFWIKIETTEPVLSAAQARATTRLVPRHCCYVLAVTSSAIRIRIWETQADSVFCAGQNSWITAII